MLNLFESEFIDRRYRLIKLIGSGGMGSVYRTEDRLTGAVVALKQVLRAPEDLASDLMTTFKEEAARFASEAS